GCAGFRGAGVPLPWVPTERPPPSRLASASVATRLAPASSKHMPSNRLPIRAYRQLLMLSKADAAMHRHHACGKVEDFDLGEASRLHHALQLRLVRMHADRLGEIAVGLGRARHALAEPGKHLERIEIVGTL